MRHQRDEGDSVVFISHKLREVLAIADRITVMRQGKNVKTLDRSEADVDTITKLMIGGDVPAVKRKRTEAGETVMEVGGAHRRDDRGEDAVRDLSLNPRRRRDRRRRRGDRQRPARAHRGARGVALAERREDQDRRQ